MARAGLKFDHNSLECTQGKVQTVAARNALNPWSGLKETQTAQWVLGKLANSGSSPKGFIEAFCAMLLLRVGEWQNQEDRAIAEFEGTTPAPEWPWTLKWEAVDNDLDLYAGHLADGVWPKLKTLQGVCPAILRELPGLVDPHRIDAWTWHTAATVLSSYTAEQMGDPRLANEFELLLQSIQDRDFSSSSTPPRLRELMVDIAAPQPGETVYDPCFGLGGLLVESARRMSLGGEGRNRGQSEQVQHSGFFGVECNSFSYLIATVRLLLAGIREPRLTLGDALERAPGQGPTFDCVLAALPFGLRIERPISSQYSLQTSSGEALFLQHILSVLKPGGRAVVMVPEGILFRRGPEEKLRKLLLTESRLEAVVSLPVCSLAPYNGVKTSLLVFQKLEPLKDVLFIASGVTEAICRKDAGVEDLSRAKEDVLGLLGRPSAHDGRKFLARVGIAEDAEGNVLGEERYAWRESVDSLAERGWELLAREKGDVPLQTFLAGVKEAVGAVKVVPLAEVAEVFAGMAFDTRQMVEGGSMTPAEKGKAVGVVRIPDLAKSGRGYESVMFVMTTSRHLTPEAAVKLAQKQLLRAEDILVSVDGSVGYVATAGDYLGHLVAGKGVAVIRIADKDLQYYLPLLLTSEPYQAWLAGQARGSTIRHLNLAALREMPIPVLQKAHVGRLAGHLKTKQSAETILQLLRGERRRSVWLSFLLDDPAVRLFSDRGYHEARTEASQTWLRQVVEHVRELIVTNTAPSRGDYFFDWLRGFQHLGETLLEVMQVPAGQDRYVSLQSWRLFVRENEVSYSTAYREIQLQVQHANPPEREDSALRSALRRMDGLNDNLMALWLIETQALLHDLRITGRLSPARISVGVPAEITITLKNDGPLPVRQLKAQLAPTNEEYSPPKRPACLCPFLPAGGQHDWQIKLEAFSAGRHTLNVSWTAKRLDESAASGEIQLALEAQSLRDSSRVVSLDRSPYVVGSPIDPKSKMFYGRDDVMAQINRALRTEGSSSVILLEGNRRVGKSSLLKRIATSGLGGDWVPVYVNFQGFEGTAGKTGMATGEIFYGIAKELVVAVARVAPAFRVPGVEQAVPVEEGMRQTSFLMRSLRPMFANGNPFECFQLLVQAALDAIKPRRVLLMLDEFDKVQEGIDSGITSPQLPENLRNLFHSYNGVSGILTGSRTIRRLRQEYWNVLFGLGISIAIKGLDEAAARRLVTEPVEGQLVYAPAAVDYVVHRCARQPFLIQGLCHSIFELCAATGERSVTVELAGKAADRYAQDNEHFRTVWDHIRSHRRRYLVCVVDQLAEEKVVITMDFLRDVLEQRGIAYHAIKTLIDDLEELVAFEILGTAGDQRERTYHIEIPIFSEWLRRNVDSEAHRLEALNEQE